MMEYNTYGLNENEFINNLTPGQINELKEMEVFTNDTTSYAYSRYYSDRIKYNRILSIYDIYSFNCNLNCTYCFENGIESSQSKNYMERLLFYKDFINLYYDDFDVLDFVLFGGEPLLNINYIKQISEYLTDTFFDKVIDFSITTNGTLIDKQVTDYINEYNVSEVRITLDGPEEIHNHRRPMHLKSSFKKTIEGLRTLCSDTSADIVINTIIDEDNKNFYQDLFKYLKNNFYDYFYKISFNVGKVCKPINSKKSFGLINNEFNVSEYYSIMEYILKNGGTITSPFYSCQCLNSTEKSFIISSDISIYKCVSAVGNNKFLLSTFQDLKKDPNLFLKKNIKIIENSHRVNCFSCKYLTMCNGGCKYDNYFNSKDICREYLLSQEIHGLINILQQGSILKDGKIKKRY